MKTWLTYLAAVFMALAATLVAGQSPIFLTAMTDLTVFLEQTGFCILLLMVICSFTSGIASCRKDGRLHTVLISSVIWAFASTVLLSLSAVAIFRSFSAPFPVTSTAGSGIDISVFPGKSLVGLGLVEASPLGFFETVRALMPAFLIVCFLVGYFLKPNVEVIRPAYVVMNSFSEVMFRMVRAITISSYLFVFVAASTFFSTLMQEGSIFVSGQFLTMLVIGCSAAIFIVLPLLFACTTKFRVNPYQTVYRSLAPVITGLFSGDILLTALIGQPVARHNLGCQKRIASTAIPFHAMFGRGGSAMIGTLCTLSLLAAVNPEALTGRVEVLVALVCALVSFCSALSFGSEIFLIAVLALRLFGINLYGSELTMLALLPLVEGMGVMVDSLVAAMGASWSAQLLDVRVETPYKDIL